MHNNPFFIAVEGPIGVGKTTLARILQEELGGRLLMEVFEENPFLSSFYHDRARYAFQTQIFFLLSRYRQQHDALGAWSRPEGWSATICLPRTGSLPVSTWRATSWRSMSWSTPRWRRRSSSRRW